MYYRTRLYLAAEWDGDRDLIDQIHKWKDSDFYSLDFSDAHDLTQCRDTSLPCTIKKSLSLRMSGSKIFLLIVGANTNSVTKGSCQYCKHSTTVGVCTSSWISTDNRSFIQYECDKAVKGGLKIIVLYNYANVDRSKCPEAVRYRGEHLAAYHLDYSGYAPRKVWNYQSIKNAIEKAKQ